MIRGIALGAVTTLIVAGGCVMDGLVIEEEGGILALKRDIAALRTRLGSLRTRTRRLEAKAGPEAAAERRLEFRRDLAKSGLRVTSRGPELVVTLASTVLFGPGEAKVRKGAKAPLLALAGAIARRFPERLVRVEGHTDSSPPRRVARAYPTNWELSAARSLAVARFMVDEGKLQEGRVYAAAYGQYRPVRDNATAEGRDENRRVDIVILPPVGFERITTAEIME